MKYFKKPGPFTVLDPSSRKPLAVPTCPFDDSVRLMLASAYKSSSEPGAKRLSIQQLEDIAEQVEGVREGRFVGLSDESHGILLEAFSAPHPLVATEFWAFSSGPHRKAVKSAEDKKPPEMVAQEADKSEVS